MRRFIVQCVQNDRFIKFKFVTFVSLWALACQMSMIRNVSQCTKTDHLGLNRRRTSNEYFKQFYLALDFYLLNPLTHGRFSDLYFKVL